MKKVNADDECAIAIDIVSTKDRMALKEVFFAAKAVVRKFLLKTVI